METFTVSDNDGGQFKITRNPDGSYNVVGTSGKKYNVLSPSKLVLDTETNQPAFGGDDARVIVSAIKTYENESANKNPEVRADGSGPGGGDTGLSTTEPLETSENSNTFKLKRNLIYPLETNGERNKKLDYFKLTAYEYSPDSTILEFNSDSSSRIEDRVNAADSLGTIYLPMQPSEDRSSVGYGPSGINQLQKIATQFFGETARRPEKILDNLKTTIGKAGGLASEIKPDDITAFFGGRSVGTDLFTRSNGKILNNNLELLFNGPELRTFSYNYTFNPRSENESKDIRTMFKWLKKNMLAKNTGLFLKSPNFFKPEYKTFDDKSGDLIDHPFLNKIGYCFLTGMNINYIPDNSYMTYSNKSMTSYNLQLELTEINPIYSDAINLTTDVMDF